MPFFSIVYYHRRLLSFESECKDMTFNLKKKLFVTFFVKKLVLVLVSLFLGHK